MSITIDNQQDKYPVSDKIKQLITKSVGAAIETVKFNLPCHIDVIILCDEEIRKLNLQYRNLDSATDVLSFPIASVSGGIASETLGDIDPENSFLMLGDMIISIESAMRKSVEIGITLDEEMAMISIHSTLHLLGYNHDDDQSYDVMNRLMIEALSGIGFDELAADLDQGNG